MSIPSIARGHRWGLALALAVLPAAGACTPHYGPRVASGVYVVHQLPRGHVSFVYGGHRHFFHDGRFYRRYPRGYVVVPPPRGAVLSRLPRGGRSYRRGKAEYKEYGGVVFERIERGRRGGYRVEGRRGEGRRGRYRS